MKGSKMGSHVPNGSCRPPACPYDQASTLTARRSSGLVAGEPSYELNTSGDAPAPPGNAYGFASTSWG